MTPLDRQYRLKSKGYTQNQIARAFGVSDSAISKVIFGKSISDRIMRGIAQKMGLAPEKVFPEHYKSKKVSHKPKKGRRAA
jgi:transcriptional regulator with XRE-family HTH domain